MDVAVKKEPTPGLESKIMIVDDEMFNCQIILGFLMVLGVENRQELADVGLNGEQAVELVKAAIEQKAPLRYKVILMDCNMPFMDGYEATKVIRKLWSDAGIARSDQPPILAVTGHVEKEYVQRALDAGMDKVYSKPLQMKDFAKELMTTGFIKSIPAHIVADDEDD